MRLPPATRLVVTGDSAEILESEVQPIIEAFLAKRGLRLSAEETVVRHVDAGLDFLGMTVRKDRGQMLMKPSKKGVLSRLSELFFPTSRGAVARLAPFGGTSRAVAGA